jgi:hypothetical protein
MFPNIHFKIFFFSCLFSKYLKIIFGFLRVCVCVCETLSLTLKEEHGLRVSEKSAEENIWT